MAVLAVFQAGNWCGTAAVAVSTFNVGIRLLAVPMRLHGYLSLAAPERFGCLEELVSAGEGEGQNVGIGSFSKRTVGVLGSCQQYE